MSYHGIAALPAGTANLATFDGPYVGQPGQTAYVIKFPQKARPVIFTTYGGFGWSVGDRTGSFHHDQAGYELAWNGEVIGIVECGSNGGAIRVDGEVPSRKLSQWVAK